MNIKPTVKHHLDRLLLWWWEGLLYCLPRSIRKGQRGSCGILLSLRDNHLAVTRTRGDETDVQRYNLHDSQEVAACSEFLAQAREDNAEQVLILSEDEVLRQTLRLPVAVLDSLENVVQFEMDHRTPFTPDQVYFDYKAGKKSVEGHIDVELAVIPRPRLDQQRQSLAAYAINIDRVDIVTDDGVALGFNLMEHGNRNIIGDKTLRNTRAFWWLAATLLLAALYLPQVKQYQHIQQLEASIASNRSVISRLESLQSEYDGLKKRQLLLVDKYHAQPAAIEILNELTERLPDDTWVRRLTINNDAVEITGESGNASALIGIVQASPYFSNTHFRAPITNSNQTSNEQYHIATKLMGHADAPDA